MTELCTIFIYHSAQIVDRVHYQYLAKLQRLLFNKYKCYKLLINGLSPAAHWH